MTPDAPPTKAYVVQQSRTLAITSRLPDGVGGLFSSTEEEKSVAKGEKESHNKSGIIGCELSMTQQKKKKEVSVPPPPKAIAKFYPQDIVNENVNGSGNFDHKPLKAPPTLMYGNDFSKIFPVHEQARMKASHFFS